MGDTMADRSIILKEWEVRAFLDKRKTLIVRPMKPQPNPFPCWWPHEQVTPSGAWVGNTWHWASESHFVKGTVDLCPFGTVGDRLIGKETWWHYKLTEIEQAGFVGGTILKGRHADVYGYHPNLDFRPYDYPIWKKRSPALMPRWASRFLFDVISVRVMRVQDVREDDVRELGFNFVSGSYEADCFTPNERTRRMRDNFSVQWSADFPKYPYDSNPWIWIAEVRRV